MIPAIVAFILTVFIMSYAAAKSIYPEDSYNYFDYKSYKPRIDSSIPVISPDPKLKNRVDELERKLDILTGDDKNDAYRSADNAERYRAMLEEAALAEEAAITDEEAKLETENKSKKKAIINQDM